MCHGWAIGSPAFREQLRETFVRQQTNHSRFELLGTDSLALRQLRAELWEKKLQEIADAAGINLHRFPAVTSAEAKVLLAVALKMLASVFNQWVAERLGLGVDGHGVGPVGLHLHRVGAGRRRPA